ncbi:hypothetical protein GCM10011351_10870 [Paraliobacillus quinghaiensis]|uniref:DUF2383 domain-containing protein n=1 Tax=Paraliobacillus quinghaiensis TaxID=470815 RepID=A0A917TN33_9BACI|nr:DUF2383 domain-containing protein [Paraliobacillus quinghaiensis]GGM26939.1 hypothetical protein GCM10011351_10870 [Paraliobacillus quinghaiensis]
MNNGLIIEELNTILRASYMGIHSFEHYIQRLDDDELKKSFQTMQQDTKQSALKIAERIQNLGGEPANSEGFSGAMHSYMHKLKISGDPQKILEDAIKGINNYGVEYSEELVKGDLDQESKEVVEEVIDTNRKHVEQLKQLLH